MDQRRDDPGPRGNGIQPPFSGEGGKPSGRDAARGDRLPPPMFPPGSKRVHTRSAPRVVPPDPAESAPQEAIIQPDEPLQRAEPVPSPQAAEVPMARGDADLVPEEAFTASESEAEASFQEALIHPDAPIARSTPRTPEEVIRGAAAEAVVTGIGESPRWDRALDQLAIEAGDPHVAELTRMVRKLSDGLTTRGEVALKATPELKPFEATLRAYCVGFLSRAREGRDR